MVISCVVVFSYVVVLFVLLHTLIDIYDVLRSYQENHKTSITMVPHLL